MYSNQAKGIPAKQRDLVKVCPQENTGLGRNHQGSQQDRGSMERKMKKRTKKKFKKSGEAGPNWPLVSSRKKTTLRVRKHERKKKREGPVSSHKKRPEGLKSWERKS